MQIGTKLITLTEFRGLEKEAVVVFLRQVYDQGCHCAVVAVQDEMYEHHLNNTTWEELEKDYIVGDRESFLNTMEFKLNCYRIPVAAVASEENLKLRIIENKNGISSSTSNLKSNTRLLSKLQGKPVEEVDYIILAKLLIAISETVLSLGVTFDEALEKTETIAIRMASNGVDIEEARQKLLSGEYKKLLKGTYG